MPAVSTLPEVLGALGGVFGHAPETDANRTRVGVYASVILQNDAIDAVEELFSRQLGRAHELTPPINTAIEGDGEARAAFWLLLDRDVQRDMFLKQCKSRHFWPRIRTLVGSPPFSFLNPEDDAVLNASGITAKRAHMAPLERAPILSSGEIADGHFVDHFDRKYKIVAVDGGRGAPVFRTIRPGRRIVIDLKLPRLAQAERARIHTSARADTRNSIRFPLPGDRVRLSINEKLLAPTETNEFVILVKSVQPRARKSPVCRVFCVVE